MKNSQLKNCSFVLLFVFVFAAFSLEKATIFYKNGETLNCFVEKYEVGNFAEIIDEENNKRIISWEFIKEIVFSKEESKSMLDAFNYKEEVVSPKEQEFIKEIQEENTGNEPTFDLDKKTGEISVDYYQTLESDAKRRCWLEDGGVLLSKRMTLNYTYASMGMDTGTGSETDFTMNGFGFSMSGAMKFLNPPNYSKGKNNWNAFSMGVMCTYSMTNGELDITYPAPLGSTTIGITNRTFEFSTNIGYTYGIGKFWSESDWKGIMLGLFWKPNYTVSRSTQEINGSYYEGDPAGAFNAIGIQWTIDWGDFGALAENLAQEAHFSITGFILPETDDTPLLLSIGVGAVWY